MFDLWFFPRALPNFPPEFRFSPEWSFWENSKRANATNKSFHRIKSISSERMNIGRFHLCEVSRKGKFIEAESKFMAVRGPEEQRMGKRPQWAQFLFGMMETFWNQMVVMVAQLCGYTKTHGIVHLNGRTVQNVKYSTIRLFKRGKGEDEGGHTSKNLEYT